MIPSAAELAIYEQPNLTHESRVAVTIGPKMWTEAFEDTFDSPLTPDRWWYTQHGGVAPLVDGSLLQLRVFGGPPREMVITRKHAFPERSDLAFRVTIRAVLQQLVPNYAAVITVGGAEQLFGVENEPMRIILQGRAYTTSGAGKIWVGGAGTIYIEYPGDGSAHDYVCEWDPNAAGGPGAEKLTVKRDGVIIAESSHPYYAVQPRYVSIGLIQPTRFGSQSNGGTVATPITIGWIDSVKIEEMGDGYESDVTPIWTTPDLGNTRETAADGEIFQEGGARWAIIPRDTVTWDAEGGKHATPDGASLHLYAPHPDSPVTVPNRFLGTRWKRRTVTIDTRARSETNELTSWKRQFVGIIKSHKAEGDMVELTAHDRPMRRLNSYVSKAYLSISGDANQSGQIEGVNVGYLLGDAFEDLVDTSDIVAGGELGDTATDFHLPEVLPLSLSSGAQNLQAVITEWADRLAQTIYRRYSTSGDAQYGQIVIHVWDFGTGVADYTFNSRGSERGNENVLNVSLTEDDGEGAGQVIYNQQTPVYGSDNLSLQFLPIVGTFPSAPWPAEDIQITDSAAYLASLALSVILAFPDENGAPHYGGLAKFRWMLENSLRRIVHVDAVGQDWIEPSVEVGIEDPTFTGITDETFVVLNWKKSYTQDGVLTVGFDGVTSNWLRAILDSL